jgi:Holliday junction resolvasome RuvABC ATP-dependent DNA helicase subunit
MSRGIDMQNGHFMMIGNRGVGKASIAKFTCYLLGIGL